MSFLSRLLRKAPADRVSTPQSEKVVSSPKAPPNMDDEIASLPFGPRLLESALDPADPTTRAAQRRLVELLDAGSISIEQLPWDAARRRAVLAVAAASANTVDFERVASRIDDLSLWKELAIEGNTAKLRQLAAARVEAPDDLRAVMKAARERDKNVYRIAKTKLDTLNAAARRVAEQRAHMLSIAETIDRHSYKPFDSAYVATVDHLEREWRGHEVEIPAEVRTRVEAAFDRAREAIAEHIRVAGIQAAREAAIANAGPLREATLDELRKILSALYSAEAFDANAQSNVTERLAKLKERWHDTLHYKAATEEETQSFEQLRRAIERASQLIIDAGTLKHAVDSMRIESSEASIRHANMLIADRALVGEVLPPLVAEAEALSTRWREQREAARANAAEAERQVTQLIRKSQHALSAGRSRQAFGIRRSIDAKLIHLPEVPKALLERIQQLDGKLQELQDWRSFAVTPKRGELIAQMQTLIGAERNPIELADEIRRLQEEWKTLAKGSADSDEDWARFHEAAQAAYAPCKAYFEAQAQQRERNLEQRKALLARLEAYEATTDWEQVEWKNVVNALRQAKQEWRTSGPTERAATKPIEKRFDELLAKIQARVDQEYATNLERKQTLVKQAERLTLSDDLVQATNEVKRLQSAWRSVGMTPHAQGQRLWDEFKQHCDAVFEKRRKDQTERMAELEQSEEQALALCIEVESLSQRSGEALYASAARVRELRDGLAQIGELPRDKAREVQRRVRRALEEFDHAIARERQREGDLAWDNFFDAANRIRLHQLESNADDAALKQHIASIEQWPKGGKPTIERRLAEQPVLEASANEEQLRSLAIRAEIATGASTPDTDQTQRRTMQLQALVKGIGRSSTSARDQLEALAFEWVAVGPVPTDAYEPLWARFWRCWQLARK